MKELNHQEIVLRPVITEKTLKESERHNAYTFRVRENANKVQIRRAVEHLFSVHVKGVRTQRYIGKRRRMGRSVGSTGNWKKAVVRVKEGDTIDFY
ncbi:MAG: 50S ribosomal protein L23 [Planctomycetota bacterium]